MNHIQSAIDPLITWCGESTPPVDFYFKTIDQAALNGLFPDKKTACPQCLNKIIEALQTQTGN